MMRTASSRTKSERLEARITPEQKAQLQRAASLTGCSLSDFIVSSVQAAAEDTIRTHQVLELSARDSEAFLAALENPPEPNERLCAAFEQYRAATSR
jgi:uncharacterized protein (DUF1778 family)